MKERVTFVFPKVVPKLIALHDTYTSPKHHPYGRCALCGNVASYELRHFMYDEENPFSCNVSILVCMNCYRLMKYLSRNRKNQRLIEMIEIATRIDKEALRRLVES